MTQILTEMIAQNKVERFVSRFESSYYLLACHVALPLVLTPELVNYLRVQFLKSEGVPWIAEADLLLSDLCRPVGYELYVMNKEVRVYLLQKLAQDKKFGEKRIKEIARLLLIYVQHLAKTNPFLGMKELETQKWGAMLYLDTGQTVREIARAIEECVNSAELARLLKITQDFKQQIASSGQFQNFLHYAQICNDLIRKNEPGNRAAIRRSYQIAGIEVTVPEILKIPELETFEADIATIVLEGETDEERSSEVSQSSSEEKLQQWEFKTPTVNRRGEIIKTETHTASYFSESLTESVDLEMVAIPGGTFTMGSPENEKGSRSYERPQHQVTVSPFFMGKYPITQAQWRAVCEAVPSASASRTDLKVKIDLDPDPSRFKGDRRPVENVNWYEAVEFCQRLSKLTGRDYRLPSEAEWEYACRGIQNSKFKIQNEESSIQNPKSKIQNPKYPPFHFGETITGELANYDASSTYADEPKGEESKGTTPVGQFPPNAFGLYDLHGQVWEWCLDDWHDNYEDAPTDGSAWIDDNEEENINSENKLYSAKNKENQPYTVLRGGSWVNLPVYCRSASRYLSLRRDFRDFINGFRVVCGFGKTL